MKKTIGFILFWIGIGIFITLFLPEDNLFLRIFLSAVLILAPPFTFTFTDFTLDLHILLVFLWE